MLFNGGTICMGCHITYCDPRCPDAPQPKVIARCSKCGDEIHEGDRLFQFRSDTFCELCADEMSLQDLAEWYGEQGWKEE